MRFYLHLQPSLVARSAAPELSARRAVTVQLLYGQKFHSREKSQRLGSRQLLEFGKLLNRASSFASECDSGSRDSPVWTESDCRSFNFV